MLFVTVAVKTGALRAAGLSLGPVWGCSLTDNADVLARKLAVRFASAICDNSEGLGLNRVLDTDPGRVDRRRRMVLPTESFCSCVEVGVTAGSAFGTISLARLADRGPSEAAVTIKGPNLPRLPIFLAGIVGFEDAD